MFESSESEVKVVGDDDKNDDSEVDSKDLTA